MKAYWWTDAPNRFFVKGVEHSLFSSFFFFFFFFSELLWLRSSRSNKHNASTISYLPLVFFPLFKLEKYRFLKVQHKLANFVPNHHQLSHGHVISTACVRYLKSCSCVLIFETTFRRTQGEGEYPWIVCTGIDIETAPQTRHQRWALGQAKSSVKNVGEWGWGVEGSRLEAWMKSHKSEVAIT